MAPKNTDFDKLSTNELVKHLVEFSGVPVPKADIKIMGKSNITGSNLVYSGTKQDFKEVGLSWGTGANLMCLKENYLKKKRKADEAELDDFDTDKHLQGAFRADLAHAEGTKRVHIQEGSGDTTDTQKSDRHRQEQFARQVKAAQQQAPKLRHTANLSTEQRHRVIELFDEKFKDLDDAKFQLSSPNFSLRLPFPFMGTEVPKRFMVRNDIGNYYYMGRELFGGLVDSFSSMAEGFGNPNLWVYGLMGYGKSHLLATLACFLTAYGYRVVYVPDCRICLEDSTRYIQQCLLFTWGDHPEKVKELIGLQDMNEVANFISQNWSTSVIFIIDQLNALDDDDADSTKSHVRRWLKRCRSESKAILSTSANNISFHHMTQRQNYDDIFTVYGGFTRAEMDAWWSLHSAIPLGDYTRNEVEDYTGCNPLLLMSCIEGDKFNLNCEEITRMARHAQRFTRRMKNKCTEWGWSGYQSYVNACITERAVPDDIDPEYVDHRFFHEKNRIGYCICGAVREAVIKELASLGTYLFSVEDSMRAMGHLISNPSVVGCFLENAILRTIVTSGIPCLDIIGPMPQFIFQEFPSYNLSHERALYVPKVYNFSAIDAILLRLNNVDKKAELIPIQITIQKAHRKSETQFFNNWSFWQDYLDDYDVSVTFLWITADGSFKQVSMEERLRKTRRGGDSDKVVWPNYNSTYIPLSEVNGIVWRKYEEVKARQALLLPN